MVRGRILCAFVGEPAMLTPAQSPRTNVKSSGAAAPDRNCVRNVCTSRACATITPLAVGAPTIVMTATNESPAIVPLPSHATPENVRRTPNAPISLDFEVTDSPMNSSDGVTERHAPANADGDGTLTAVSAGPAGPTAHPINAHSTVITDNRRIITP